MLKLFICHDWHIHNKYLLYWIKIYIHHIKTCYLLESLKLTHALYVILHIYECVSVCKTHLPTDSTVISPMWLRLSNFLLDERLIRGHFFWLQRLQIFFCPPTPPMVCRWLQVCLAVLGGNTGSAGLSGLTGVLGEVGVTGPLWKIEQKNISLTAWNTKDDLVTFAKIWYVQQKKNCPGWCGPQCAWLNLLQAY